MLVSRGTHPKYRRLVSRFMTSEWTDWHKGYAQDTHQARRLGTVQDRIREALSRCPEGPIRLLSLCSGDGRDLLGVLRDHPRSTDVRAKLVDSEPRLVAEGREQVARWRLEHIEFVQADASDTSACVGAVPADIILACGIFGNVTDDDVRNAVRRFPELLAPGGTVIWTRGRFEPDLTPTIRTWFRESGFEELSWVAIPGSTASVGAHRLTVPPKPFQPGVRLFTFLPEGSRPSSQAQRKGNKIVS